MFKKSKKGATTVHNEELAPTPKGEHNKPPMNRIEATKNQELWEMDEKGYFLIDPRSDDEIIYAHHYTNDKRYQCSIAGETAEEISHTIIEKNMVKSLLHMAYLGQELEKAELTITYDTITYEQDTPLRFTANNEQEEEEE